MSHHIVEAQGLGYSYPDGTPALEDIRLRVEHGEAVALVGENGAGKSTLLRHFTGCLFASSGGLVIGGLPVEKKNLAEVRRAVGMVFQNPDDQLFMPTVFEDVAFGLLNLGIPAAELEGRVMEALATVGAAHLRARPPYRLSQGEKRAVAIAGVLAMRPDILIMDEPTSNLDPASRRRLINLLRTFKHTRIIATHDLDFALEVCGRAVLLHRGRVIADGPAAKVLADDALLAAASLEKPPSLGGPVAGRG